jgi:hypothetical protein
MKHLLPSAGVLCLGLALPLAAEAMRCGTKLVQEGDLAIQVREKCGDPVSEEVIGYTLRGGPHYNRVAREREYKVEQWIYGPRQGYYDVLIFEAGRLRDIDKIKD